MYRISCTLTTGHNFCHRIREHTLTFNKQTNKLRGLSPQANYTDRATAACRRSLCQLWRIEGVAWSVQRVPTAVNQHNAKWKTTYEGHRPDSTKFYDDLKEITYIWNNDEINEIQDLSEYLTEDQGPLRGPSTGLQERNFWSICRPIASNFVYLTEFMLICTSRT
jgi:hypothetical protein